MELEDEVPCIEDEDARFWTRDEKESPEGEALNTGLYVVWIAVEAVFPDFKTACCSDMARSLFPELGLVDFEALANVEGSEASRDLVMGGI